MMHASQESIDSRTESPNPKPSRMQTGEPGASGSIPGERHHVAAQCNLVGRYRVQMIFLSEGIVFFDGTISFTFPHELTYKSSWDNVEHSFPRLSSCASCRAYESSSGRKIENVKHLGLGHANQKDRRRAEDFSDILDSDVDYRTRPCSREESPIILVLAK